MEEGWGGGPVSSGSGGESQNVDSRPVRRPVFLLAKVAVVLGANVSSAKMCTCVISLSRKSPVGACSWPILRPHR
jgi:hypothetical protein